MTLRANLPATIPDPTPREAPCPPNGPNSASTTVGRPVNVITGNAWFDQVDAVVTGVVALNFTRSYNSAAANATRIGAFGNGWSSTYEKHLQLTWIPSKVMALWESNGDLLLFQDYGDGVYVPAAPLNKDSTIQAQGDGTFIRAFRKGGSETFDAQGKLTRLTDPVGNITTLTYTTGKLTLVAAPGGRSLTITYNPAGFVSSLSGPAGLIANYTYDASNRLDSVRYPQSTGGFSGHVFAFSGTGSLIATVKEASWTSSGTVTLGRTIETHTYDTTKPGAPALTSSVSDGVEGLSLVYPSSNTLGQTQVTDALLNVTTYYWSDFGSGIKSVYKIVGPCVSCGGGGQQTQQWTYDDQGRIATYKDGLGHSTAYAYDANGDLTSETDAAGGVTSYTHDSLGRVLTVTRPDGSVTTKTYAAAGPLTVTEKVSASVNRTTTLAYNAQGKPTSITDPRGKITTLAYNATGDLTSVTDPLSHATTFGYDSMGRRTTATNALSQTTTTTYNSRGWVTRITNPDTTFTDFGYDLGGRRTTVTDPLNKVTTYGYDAYGRLVTVTDPATGVTTYGYDSMSHLTSLTDARGKVTTFDYDPYGRVQKVTYPGTPGPFETYTYDAAGHLATRTDRKNVVTTYTYDLLGRLTGKTYSDTTPAVSYTYDAGGRLLTAGNGTDSLAFTYDLVGQLLSEGSTKNASTVAYTYDLGGNRLDVSLNGSVYLTYAYDNASRLTSVNKGTNAFTFSYDNANRRTWMWHPNAVGTGYTYDSLARLTNLTVTKGAATITSSAYAYDSAGNRLTKTMPTYAETYTYDNLYRLTNASRAGTATETYTYDAVGNRLSSLGVPGWSYDDRNELLSQNAINYTYDANGNLDAETNGSAWDYEWNAENQLTRALHNGVEVGRYSYDPLGRRVEKVAAGVTTKYTYDGEDILRTIKGSQTLKYVHGPGIDEPLAVDDGLGGLAGFHADGLGSIVKATDPWGTVIGGLSYDAFGNVGSGAPALSVPGTTLGFGSVNTGFSLDRTIMVRNAGGGVLSGGAAVTGTGFTLVGPASFSLAANQSQAVTVRYTPAAAGNSTGTLTLTGGGGATVALTGLGRTSGTATATLNVETAYPSQTVTVTIANGPGNPTDWLALYVPGALDTTNAVSWKYLNGTQTAPATGLTSATVTFLLPVGAGTYEARFFSNNGYTLLARSATLASQTTLPPGPYAYTGREWDPETGLYYYRARYYDPKVGRFLGEDPIGFWGGANFFSYVHQSPATLTDPMGLTANAPAFPPTFPAAPPMPGKRPRCCNQDKLKKTYQSTLSQIIGMYGGKMPSGNQIASSTATAYAGPSTGGWMTPIPDPPQFFNPLINPRITDPCERYCTRLHEWIHFTDTRPWNVQWAFEAMTIDQEYPAYVQELECLYSFLK